ncbi:MAG: TrmB family transcriptional regulator [Candidatus Woesearchaeota archaeon]
MKEVFYELGFDEKETQIYLALIKLRQGKVSDLLKITKIERRTIYDVLERLVQKGYATFFKENNTLVYKPINPELIVKKLDKQKNEFEEIIPQIKDLESKESNTEVEILKGRQGITTIFQEILQTKEHLGMGDLAPFIGEYKREAKRFILGMIKSNHKEKILYPKGQKIEKIKTGEYKEINKDKLPTIQTIIYENTVVQFILDEVPYMIKIKNKKVADTHRDYFYKYWN